MKISSFDDAILENDTRFIEYALKENPNIKDFGDFQQALFNGLKNNHGEIQETTIISLFENPATKEAIKENVDSEEYDKLYGDGNFVKREVVGKQVITITEPKVHTREYVKSGKVVHSYNKGYKRWTPSEERFVQARVEKKISPSQISKQFNVHFHESPRTMSSITSKASKSGKSFKSF